VWAQDWLDVLFLHWSVPVESIRPRLPTGCEPDERDGEAWVSLVLFRLKVRPVWLPFVPGFSTLAEVNLRTYIRVGEQTGVYFLSLSATNSWAALIARVTTPLPYRGSRFYYRRAEEGSIFVRQTPGQRLDLT